MLTSPPRQTMVVPALGYCARRMTAFHGMLPSFRGLG